MRETELIAVAQKAKSGVIEEKINVSIWWMLTSNFLFIE